MEIGGKKYDIAFAKSNNELNKDDGYVAILNGKKLIIDTNDGKVVLSQIRYYIQDMVSPSPF